MPFLRRAVRRRPPARGTAAVPSRALRVLALSLLAAACGSSSSSSVTARPRRAAAGRERHPELGVGAAHLLGPGHLERRVGRARARPRLRLDHHPRPARHGRARPGDVLEVRRQRQERDVHAAARPEVHRRHAARRRGGQGEHRARPEAVQLQHRLGAGGHLQGRGEQPDQLHPRPGPGRLPGAGPAGRQGRDDGQPGRVHQERRQPAHPPGRRRAVQADQLRARTPTPTWCATPATGTPARSTWPTSPCSPSPSRSRSWPRWSPARSTWPTSPETRWRRPRPPGSRSP